MSFTPASERFATWPTVGVSRSDDCQRFFLMHMAKVNPGHYVGWGEFEEHTRDDFIANGRDHVVRSLREFASRNGKNRRKRLKLTGTPPLHQTYDLVRVRAVAPEKIELAPYRRGARQHEQLDDKKTALDLNVPAEVFFSEIEAAFSRGAA